MMYLASRGIIAARIKKRESKQEEEEEEETWKASHI
jgi:hypothetical protein